MPLAAVCLFAGCVSDAAQIRLRTRTIDPAADRGWPGDLTAGAWIVQSPGPITGEWRDRLEASGAKIHGYLPDDAYLIQADAPSLRRIAESLPHSYLGRYLPADKRVASGGEPNREFLVIVFDESDRPVVAERIRAIEGCSVVFDCGEIVRARLTPPALDTVASWDEVAWLDLSVVNISRPLCDRSCREDAMDVAPVWPRAAVDGLAGRGQVVAVADTGLDNGDLETLHEDIRGRVSRVYAIGRPGDWSDFIGHGTHICGSVLGNGAMSGGRIKGPAYEATLIMQSLCDEHGGTARPTDLADLFRQAYTNEGEIAGAKIHCNSWGSGRDDDAEGAELLGVYVEDCRAIDRFCFTHPDLLVLFASGNDAMDGDGDGVVDLDSLNSQATAKNIIAVGGAENSREAGHTYGEIYRSRYPADPVSADDIAKPYAGGSRGMAAFSGRGPCDDGRIKPDVVAPATMICAPRSSVMRRPLKGPYHYKNGTSMAAPLVAGAAALVREWLARRKGLDNPDAATVKALLVAGARSLAPGQYGEGEWREIPSASPNPVEGWGMVDVARSVGADGTRVDVCDAWVLAEGEVASFGLGVHEGDSISVVLAYADAPAELAAASQLVNDLDLRVVTPSGKVLWPNSLDGPDRLNNVEGVKVESAEGGVYTVEVSAHAIPSPMPLELTGGRRNATRYSLVAATSATRSPQSTRVSVPAAELATMSSSNFSAPARVTTTTVEPPNLK